MEAYVINLKGSKDRWTSIQKSFEPTRIQLHRVDPVKARNGHSTYIRGAFSLFLTVLKLLKDAKKKYLPNILILEDDCTPVANFSKKWSTIKEWLDAHTDQWDIYSGGSTMIKDPRPVAKVDTVTFYRPKESWSANFIYIHKDAYDTVIDKYMKDYKDMETIATNVTNYKVKLLISYPFVAYQKDGYSILEKRFTRRTRDMKKVERKLRKTRKVFLKHKSKN